MKYDIKRVIAKNTHSEVMLGECFNESQSHAVLIKTVLPPIFGKVQDQLAAAKMLEHPGIPRLVDYGECCERGVRKYYTTNLYIPGVTLTHLLQRISFFKVKPPHSLVFHIINSLCDILEYTHNFKNSRSGFFPHGNICPDHVHISFDGTVHLTDTGIADLLTYRYNGIGLIKNEYTVFNHPDIHSGKECKRCHELYSLGMLFLCMLTGYDNFLLGLEQADLQKSNSLDSMMPFIDPEICSIIERLIKAKKTGIFSSIEEIRAYMDDFRQVIGTTDEKNYSMLVTYALFYDNFDISDSIQSKIYELIQQECVTDKSLLLLFQKTGLLSETSKDCSTILIQDYKIETESIPVSNIAQSLQDNSGSAQLEMEYSGRKNISNEEIGNESKHVRRAAGVIDSVITIEPATEEFSKKQKNSASSYEAFSGIRVDTSVFCRKEKEHPFAKLIIKKNTTGEGVIPV